MVGPALPNPLTCPRCKGGYNDKDNAPLLLVPCGCTICAACLTELRSEGKSGGGTAVTCPLDGRESQHACLNQALLRQVQDSCPHHPGQSLRYFCPQDESAMCQDCAVFLHHGHERPLSLDEGLSRVRGQAKEALELLMKREADLDSVIKQVGVVREAMREKGESVKDSVREATEEAIQALVRLREVMLNEVSAAIEDRQASLQVQAERLADYVEIVAATRAEVDSKLTSRRVADISEAVGAAEKALVETEEATNMVVQDDLEYQDSGAGERRQLLAKLVDRSEKGGGVWGRLENKVAPVSQVVGLVGSVGQGEGQFQYPYHVAVDKERLYVADFGNHRIVVIDKETLVQVQVIDGSSGWTTSSSSKKLKHPSGVAVDETRLYVAESNSHAVRAMDKKTGAQVWRVGNGKAGTGEGQFNSPRQVMVDSSCVYVADYSNHRVVVLRKDTGTYVREVDCDGDLGTPEGLALDPEEPQHLYVSDYERHRVQVVHKDTGARIRTFGTVGWSGDGNHHFNSPLGLAVAGRCLYVADRANHRVQVLNKNSGTHIATLGETGRPGTAESLLDKPNGLAVDGSRLYCSEWGNHRVHIVSL